MSLELDEIQGPGFFMFFQVPSEPSGSSSRVLERAPSLFKSDFTLNRLDNDDDEIMSVIMAFMFTKR